MCVSVIAASGFYLCSNQNKRNTKTKTKIKSLYSKAKQKYYLEQEISLKLLNNTVNGGRKGWFPVQPQIDARIKCRTRKQWRYVFADVVCQSELALGTKVEKECLLQ